MMTFAKYNGLDRQETGDVKRAAVAELFRLVERILMDALSASDQAELTAAHERFDQAVGDFPPVTKHTALKLGMMFQGFIDGKLFKHCGPKGKLKEMSASDVTLEMLFIARPPGCSRQSIEKWKSYKLAQVDTDPRLVNRKGRDSCIVDFGAGTKTVLWTRSSTTTQPGEILDPFRLDRNSPHSPGTATICKAVVPEWVEGLVPDLAPRVLVLREFARVDSSFGAVCSVAIPPQMKPYDLVNDYVGLRMVDAYRDMKVSCDTYENGELRDSKVFFGMREKGPLRLTEVSVVRA